MDPVARSFSWRDELPQASQRHPQWALVPDADWGSWRWQLKHRITDLDELSALVSLTESESRGFAARVGVFPVATTPYYLSLFGDPSCGVRRQAIPLLDETRREPWDQSDPLAEEEHSPVACLSHRYPDRALLYVTHNCAVYCRHCTRQRKVGDALSAPRKHEIDAAIEYIRAHDEIFDVLISGGDPLSLSDARLCEIVAQLRSIDHVGPIRICTRTPVTLPARVTAELSQALAAYAPVYVSTHFNHPGECTPEAAKALANMADAGLNVGNQMVLLAGINDDPLRVEALNRWLVMQRARPYYMFQCDLVHGTAHLRTPIAKGLEILDWLRGRVSGLAIPQFAVDLPGGGGKVTLSPERLLRQEGSTWVFRDHRGREFEFREPLQRPAGATQLPILSAAAAHSSTDHP